MFATSAVRSAAKGSELSKKTTFTLPFVYFSNALRVPEAQSFDSAETP